MRLTNRDIKIIEYVDVFQGGTIEQIKLLFFPSYDMCKKRLKILKDNKFLKADKHPVLNKLVYYNKKMPSYHTLVVNHISILAKDNIIDFRKEYIIDKFKVDALMVTKNKKVIVIEVDIFNKTSKEKVDKIKASLKSKLGMDARVIIVAKERRRKKGPWEEVKLEEIEKIKEVI